LNDLKLLVAITRQAVPSQIGTRFFFSAQSSQIRCRP
jgi:hypothetical protein